MFIGWLGQGWEGGSKARSLEVSEIRVTSSETNKKDEVTGGGWVGVSGQLTTSDSYKSWYLVYTKSGFPCACALLRIGKIL